MYKKITILFSLIYAIMAINFIRNNVNALEFLTIGTVVNIIFLIIFNISNKKKNFINVKYIEGTIITIVLWMSSILYAVFNLDIKYLSMLLINGVTLYFFVVTMRYTKGSLMMTWFDKIFFIFILSLASFLLTLSFKIFIIIILILFLFIIGPIRDFNRLKQV